MKIVEPKIRLENYDGKKIEKNIEKACRKCYRSEDNTTEDSYKKLLSNCINRGHESVLEHEKITAEMVTSVSAYKELTRHRFASFSIESTRYCSYNKDKFGNEIKFIKPVWYNEAYKIAQQNNEPLTEEEQRCLHWKNIMQEIENTYLEMGKLGAKPDELRMILPHSTAAEVTMTANIREWRHILDLRTKQMAHPEMQQIMIPVLLQFKKDMPELFKDIEYNKDFPVEKYASVEIDREEER